MSSDYNNNLWKAILGELRTKIPARLYDLWFKESQVLSFSEEIIKIQVPNTTIAKRIQEKYLNELKESIFRSSRTEPEIEFVIPEVKEGQALFDFENESARQESVSEDRSSIITPSTLNLNATYTFPNFVVGPSNQLAHASALAVAKTPGKVYNPLFMYGAVGLGKTHLLQAICHELIGRGYKQTIVYLSCEDFINEFVTALEHGDVNGFRNRYRNISVLLIDDIHFLANKDRTQEEFFHTFNTLYNANKQIILSSDSPPSEIPELKERLLSRFKWGLVAPINVPSFETRVAIVKKKSRLRGQELPEQVCQYISEHVISNIRELEGAVNHLFAMADLNKKEITLEFAKRALKELISFHETEIEFVDILDTVAKCFNVKVSDLKAKKRSQSIVFPRQVGMYLAKNLTKRSLQEIGSFFGGRDHSTVLHAIDKVKECQEKNQRVAELIKKIEKEILDDIE